MLKRMTTACVLAALGTSLWTGEAKADVHGFTWDHATLNGGPRFATDNLDFGLGLNVGYTLDMGLYLGGLFDYFFAQRGVDVWFLMFDCGFDIGLGSKFVLRPTGSIGIANADYEGRGSNNDFAGAVGANALHAIAKLTLGGEIRFFFGQKDFDGVGI